MAAILEVLTLLKTTFEGVGVTVATDRQDDDPITEREGEVVALNFNGAECAEPTGCANYLWTAQISIEPWANVTQTQTPLERVTALIALIAPPLAADPTLGGKLWDCNFVAVPSGLDEMTGERGTIGIVLEVKYFTTKADPTTINPD